jgi:DNA-binding transcriptional MerR regulator
MKTTLEIARELGLQKQTVAHVITKEGIKPVHIECNKNYFDDDQVEQIKRILRFELKIN